MPHLTRDEVHGLAGKELRFLPNDTVYECLEVRDFEHSQQVVFRDFDKSKIIRDLDSGKGVWNKIQVKDPYNQFFELWSWPDRTPLCAGAI